MVKYVGGTDYDFVVCHVVLIFPNKAHHFIGGHYIPQAIAGNEDKHPHTPCMAPGLLHTPHGTRSPWDGGVHVGRERSHGTTATGRERSFGTATGREGVCVVE